MVPTRDFWGFLKVFGRFFERLKSDKIDIIDTLLASEWTHKAAH